MVMRRHVRGGRAKEPRNAAERRYRRLGAAVIVSAVRDLETLTRAGGASVRAGASARAFLTISNAHWCRVADVDMNAILRMYGQGATVARLVGDVEPDAFDDVVKKPRLGRPARVHREQARDTARQSGTAP
jgi:hypothetical protein